MIGEIRDTETAQIAIQSALTGHLVFTTVHANNVIDVIGRFLNMGVEPYNFVSCLNCVLAQRLVRMLCPYCKRQYRAKDQELVESGLRLEEHRDTPSTSTSVVTLAITRAIAGGQQSMSCSISPTTFVR